MRVHALGRAKAAQLGGVELGVSPAATDVVGGPWRARHTGLWSDQGAGNLGERMACAVQRVLAAGRSVLLVGTDCPALDAAHLRRAAAALTQHDACLIPAYDGGYVLLGLRRFDATVFSEIAWSTPSVARVTLDRLRQLGWSVQVFAPVHDIDEPADLPYLPGDWVKTLVARVPEAS